MAYTQKLYNEYKVKDLTWVNKIAGVYGVALADLDGLISSPSLDSSELSKFNYQGESKINGYIYPRQYFILDDYLWINFDTVDPATCRLTLQFPKDEDQVLGYVKDSYILTIQSRTNNTTYITDASGSVVPESSRSNAPYNRSWILDSEMGAITIHNCGVSTATCIEFSGGGGGEYTLPTATASRLGGVKIGEGVNVAADGTISVTPGAVEIATTSKLGVIKVGTGLSIAQDGTLSAVPQAIAIATKELAGIVQIGDGIEVDEDGVISVPPVVVPTKTSDLENDSGFLTEHQDISGKVDKEAGKSLVADTDIAKIGANELAIQGLQTSKVDVVPGKGLSTNDYTNADKDKVEINADAQFNQWAESQVPSENGYGNTNTISFYPKAFTSYSHCYVKAFHVLVRSNIGGWFPPTSPIYCKLVDPATDTVLSESDGHIPQYDTYSKFTFDNLVKLDSTKRYEIRFFTTKSGTESYLMGIRLFLASTPQEIYAVNVNWLVITKFDFYISTNDYVDAALSDKVSKTTTIAGIDLQDNITKQELREALDIPDGSGSGDENVIEVVKVNGVEQDVDPSDKSVNISVPTALSELTNDAGFIDEEYLESKDLGTISISGTWTWTKNDGTAVSGGSSNNANIQLENGFKASWSGTWKWDANSSQKDAVACSGAFGTELPAKNTATAASKSAVGTNTTYTQTISAPKTGLMVSGTKVVPASGNDIRSVSISVTFLHRYYLGYATTKSITEEIIKELANTALTSTKTLTKNVNTNSDQYVVYAYPSALGDLTKITMDGATPVLGAFTKIGTVNVTNAAGSSITYTVYVSNNPGAFVQTASLKFE